ITGHRLHRQTKNKSRKWQWRSLDKTFFAREQRNALRNNLENKEPDKQSYRNICEIIVTTIRSHDETKGSDKCQIVKKKPERSQQGVLVTIINVFFCECQPKAPCLPSLIKIS